MTVLNRLRSTWLDRPWTDYPLTAVAALGAGWLSPHDLVTASNYGSWYQTLAGVSGVLLGLGGIAITLVFTVTPSERLAVVYFRLGLKVERLVMSCLGALAVTTAGFALMFALESARPAMRFGALGGLVALSALRACRLWWLLRRILQALMHRYAEDEPAPEPWIRPVVTPEQYGLPARRARRKRSAEP